jgi:hypothetical protein
MRVGEPRVHEAEVVAEVLRAGRDVNPGALADLLDSLAAQLGYERNVRSISRGKCGHVWDRGIEDTDECPRCAVSAKLAVRDEALYRISEYPNRNPYGDPEAMQLAEIARAALVFVGAETQGRADADSTAQLRRTQPD